METAVEIFCHVVDRFGDAADPDVVTQVAKALVGEGMALAVLGRLSDALGVLDLVLVRFGESGERALQE